LYDGFNLHQTIAAKRKKMNCRRFFAALLLIGAGAALQAETLVVFGDDGYFPVVHLKDGTPAGVLPAILAHAESLTGDSYVLKLSPWKRAYELAVRAEGGVLGVSFNQERAKTFDFSKSIFDDDIQIVALKSRTFAFAKLEDLKGKVIGGVLGASYGDEVDRAIAEGLFTVERDVGQSGRLRKLLAGRLDAAFIGNGNAGFLEVVGSVAELRTHRSDFVILPKPLARDPLHLAFSKTMNKRAALARFDAALEKMKKSGQLQSTIAAAMQ
jgi:polar amino acid transport system substrate-binding protein